MSVVFQFFLSLFRGSDPLTHQCLFSTNNVPGTNSGSSNAAAESNCQFFFSWTDILQSIREDARRCLFICQSTHIFLSISILFCFVFFNGVGEWTKSHVHSRQVLCHWAWSFNLHHCLSIFNHQLLSAMMHWQCSEVAILLLYPQSDQFFFHLFQKLDF